MPGRKQPVLIPHPSKFDSATALMAVLTPGDWPIRKVISAVFLPFSGKAKGACKFAAGRAPGNRFDTCRTGPAADRISLKILSVIIFVAMSAFIKAADVPAGEIVFFRSFFALFPLLVFMAWNGDLSSAYKTSRPGSHFARGLVGTTAMGLGFFALTRLPLPEAVTLNYAQPLLVVVFSALFLAKPSASTAGARLPSAWSAWSSCPGRSSACSVAATLAGANLPASWPRWPPRQPRR
jgi:uncharacterized membrane protein